MKNVKRIVTLFLSVLLAVSFCACSSDTQKLSAKRTVAFEQAKHLDTGFETVAIMHYKLKEGCRDRINAMFCVSTHNAGLEREQTLVNDLYMLDLDTGYWYMDAQIDEDSLNFDTKENALAFFFHAFDQARGKPALWNEEVELDYLPPEDVDYINQLWMQNSQAKTITAYWEDPIDLNLNSIRRFLIEETLGQPAGLARNTIETIAEAITYLNLHFPTLSADVAVVRGEDRTIRSGIEIIEDVQRPAAAGDMATCVSYFLGDRYEIETLAVFVMEDAGEDAYPLLINSVKLDDGYWFVDPAARMNQAADISGAVHLPEMKCDSIESYIDSIRQDFSVNAVFTISNGGRMDYQVVKADGIAIETNSACAELIYSNPAS